MELKTARLTILIDPAKKSAFETLCRTQDMTPSQVVRRLIRLGHPRLRELRAEAMRGRGLRAWALRAGVRWLESGVLRVPQGYAGGLAFDMRYLPIAHAHIGSALELMQLLPACNFK